MNCKSFPRVGLTDLKFLSVFLLAPLVFSVTLFVQVASAQQQQLSLVDIITVLKSKKATPAEKNALLAEGVRQRGVTFAINSDLEKELRAAGADDGLLTAIREKSPVVKIVATEQSKTDVAPVTSSTQQQQQKPQDFAFYQNRANANFVIGEYTAAITDYTKAIELNQKEPTVFFSRALAYLNTSSFSLAISDFDKVIELDPKEAMAYFKRGNAHEKLGNAEKALADYKKAFELDADNDLAKSAFEKLQAMQPKPQQQQQTPVTPTKTVAQNNQSVTQNPPVLNNVATPTKTSDSNEQANIGALNRFAARLSPPVYPAFERQRNTEGLVTVEITLDEKGDIESVKATSGPPGLRRAAEDAVRRSKFNPVMVDGKAVKATGFINFNFKVN